MDRTLIARWMAGLVFGCEMSAMPEKPTLADRAPLERLHLEGALVRFGIRWSCLTPGGHIDTRTRVVTGSASSGKALCLKCGSLMSSGIPLFRNNECSIVGFRLIKKDDIREFDSVESGVGCQRFEEKLKIRHGTGLKDVQDDGVNVRRNRVHHFQPDDGRTDDARNLGNGLPFLVSKLEGCEFLSYTTDSFAVHEPVLVVERTKALCIRVLQHLGIKDNLKFLVARIADRLQ